MAVQFYRYSFKTACEDNCTDLYTESFAENRRCREYIEDSETGVFAKAYDNGHVDRNKAYTKGLISEFGMERTMYVLAGTVKHHMDDVRISQEVKDWARNFNRGYGDEVNSNEAVLWNTQPGIVDILAKNTISEFKALELFNHDHCEDKTMDLTGKVIVLNHKYLKEEYWSPENQLWLATGGFGCNPTASGRAVYATCLFDDDQARWERHQVLGVVKDEYLPDWAREKLEEMQAQESSQDNDINLG